MSRAFRHLFFPLMIGLSIASWAFRDEGGAILLRARVPLDYATAVLLVSIAILWFAETLQPRDPEWNYRLFSGPIARAALGWNRLARDLLYLFVIAAVGTLALKQVATWLEAAGKPQGFAYGAARLWPAAAPFALRAALAFFAIEFASYWFHRLAHRVTFFWRFHQTHHVVTELTALKAVRTHPIDNVFFSIARSVPLLLLGAGAAEVTAALYLGATLGLLAHANVEVSEGPLGLVVNYPRYHEVHHSSDLTESNSNFGCHTVLFDRLFGTFRERTAMVKAVLGAHPVGGRSVWQELVAPPR
jgi:sterol desaturase/sphingolipid hydroxylase (fatty acid hydroxylase superfamily)